MIFLRHVKAAVDLETACVAVFAAVIFEDEQCINEFLRTYYSATLISLSLVAGL